MSPEYQIYTGDNRYRVLLNKLHDACSESNDCDKCSLRFLCQEMWDMLYEWTDQKWELMINVVREYRHGKRISEIARDKQSSERTIARILAEFGIRTGSISSLNNHTGVSNNG